MNRKWLVLDCNYLCHRAKFSMGDLSYAGTATGIIYGFLKSISYFQELFQTRDVVFCWDSKTNKREKIFPGYKQKRRDAATNALVSQERVKFEEDFRIQMKNLRRTYLTQIGYKNVFCQKGYESDDIIASVCFNLPMKDEAIIISADKDLYQIIRHNISCFNPQKSKMLTLQGFKKEYDIIPEQWIIVKCLAGCSTDEVPGIKGIGEKTVIKYLLGELKESSKAYKKIKRYKTKYLKKNYPLIGLPFLGTKVFRLGFDELSRKGWTEVIKKLGMVSIRDKFPGDVRNKPKITSTLL